MKEFVKKKAVIVMDSAGLPNYMTMFYMEPGTYEPEDVPELFKIRNKIVPAVLVSQFTNTMIKGVPASLPYQQPKHTISYDEAAAACGRKGKGWHLMTNTEFVYLLHEAEELGHTIGGNTNYGSNSKNEQESGVRYDSAGRTLTGCDPLTWSHDGTADGVFGLCGNFWEWVTGLRLHKGVVEYTPNNDAENLPGTVEEAENIVTNYLRRIAYRRKKLGLEPLKYILVTEYKYSKDGQCLKRIHHHIIMNGGLDRDDVELMWTKDRINWKKTDDPEYRASIKQLGWVNADRLQMNENGIEGLCKYIVKDPQGKKRYSSSRNLDRPETTREDGGEKQQRDQNHWKYSRNLTAPEEKCNDFKYSKRKVEQLAKSPDGGLEEFKKIYSNYNIVSCEPVYYEQTGWHIYLKMWKKEKPKGRTGGKKRERKNTADTPHIKAKEDKKGN